MFKLPISRFHRLAVGALFGLGLAASPSLALANTWFNCEPTEVLEVGSRVHVRCSNSVLLGSSTVRYAAVSTSNASAAARFIALANAALLSNKLFRMYLPTSTATNVSGCLVSDCRTPTAFGVRNR